MSQGSFLLTHQNPSTILCKQVEDILATSTVPSASHKLKRTRNATELLGEKLLNKIFYTEKQIYNVHAPAELMNYNNPFPRT